ncbi:MAG: hypothetical protein WBA74_27360 [Cyclobacteriaceae bacterium]
MKSIDQTNAQYFAGINKELQIDFSQGDFFTDTATASGKVIKFMNTVSVNTQQEDTILDNMYMGIRTCDFDELYNIAKKAAEKAVAAGEIDKIMTGFIVHFALEESTGLKEMNLLFQPWYAVKMKFSADNRKVCSELKVVESSEYYVYSKARGFFPAASSNALSRFWDQLLIREATSGNHRLFQNSTDYSSDSRSAFITFQQLIEFHEKAYSGFDYESGVIFPFLGVVKKNYQIHQCDNGSNDHTGLDKHKITLVLASFETSKKILHAIWESRPLPGTLFDPASEIPTEEKAKIFRIATNSFNKGNTLIHENFHLSGTAEAANLSGLCPPGCKGFQYSI